MGNIAISSNRSNMYTNISNDFIDKYIGADGTNFKVYVYLLSLKKAKSAAEKGLEEAKEKTEEIIEKTSEKIKSMKK